MEGPSFLKKDWVLTQDAFDVLLARLDPDAERAGRRYEEIRQALITFFENRGSRAAEDLADETINRVARRLLEGKEIYTGNPASYFYGVARNVLKERWQSSAATSTSLDALTSIHLSDHPGRLEADEAERRQWERRLECLERCLDGLDAQDRDLISWYYQGETSVKIESRKQLARTLGIAATALRIRAFRIREKLERCVQQCLNRHPAG